jgi:hypothetical protein
LLLAALVPLWSQLGGTVTDVRPGCAAIVQAQDPRTGQGDHGEEGQGDHGEESERRCAEDHLDEKRGVRASRSSLCDGMRQSPLAVGCTPDGLLSRPLDRGVHPEAARDGLTD